MRLNKDSQTGQNKSYKIHKGILININQAKTRIVIPKNLQDTIIQMAHDSPLGGHLGNKKTIAKITENFYWPNMTKHVKEYIKKCTVCLKHNPKDGKHTAPIQNSDKANFLFEKIAIDLIGPLKNMSKNKHIYALTIVDIATRWAEAIPLKRINAESICTALLNVFSKYGFPQTILSDNGSQFKGQMTQAIMKMLNIIQVHSTIYHPQSNGIVERFNKTIKNMLVKVTIDQEDKWHEYLPLVLFAYNSSKHESTGFSPFELMFGQNPASPLNNFKERLISKQDAIKDRYQLMSDT